MKFIRIFKKLVVREFFGRDLGGGYLLVWIMAFFRHSRVVVGTGLAGGVNLRLRRSSMLVTLRVGFGRGAEEM